MERPTAEELERALSVLTAELAEALAAIQTAAHYVRCPAQPCTCGRDAWFDQPVVKRAMEEA